MPRREIPRPDRFLDLPYPVLGLNVVTPYVAQPAMTTANTVNCRAWEPTTNRNRGGSRPGLLRWRLTRVNGQNVIQDLNVMAVSTGGTPGSSQGAILSTGPGGYALLATAISNGKLRFAISGDANALPTWYTPSVDTTFTATTGVMRSAVNIQKLYIVGGNRGQAYYWDPSTPTNGSTGGTLTQWYTAVDAYATAQGFSAGSSVFPSDSSGVLTGANGPQLICTWRGRAVLAGLQLLPNDWFMSRVSNPLDWQYSPTSPSPTQAFSSNTSTLGSIGEPITALIPYTDDVLVIGAQKSLWMITGDPGAGGQTQLITNSMGVLFGNSWCMDPYGNIFFMSNRGGVYQLVPGQQPQRISQAIEPLITQVNQQVSNVRLAWNDQQQGVHLFITPTVAPLTDTGGPEQTQHFFYDTRNGGWWLDAFANNFHNPLACVQMDGQAPSDRVPLIGGWDGYVRSIPANAADDDGIPIVSNCYFGPILTKDFDDVMVKDVQMILGSNSGPVTGFLAVGDTAEHALASTPIQLSAWLKGRNLTTQIRRAGHALYVIITGANQWVFEAARVTVRGEGLVRARGH